MNIDKLDQGEDGTHKLDGNLTSRDVLYCLEENDPTTKVVKIWTTPCIGAESFHSEEDIEQVGRALAQNTNVETLTLCIHFGVGIDKRVIRLLELLSKNRGIRHFEFAVLRKGLDIKMEDFSHLGPFFERNPNLESIVLKRLHLSPRGTNPLLDSLARRQYPLQKIEACDIGGKRAKEMLYFFRNNPALTPKRIILKRNRLGNKDCFCISDIIINTCNELEEIDLGNNSIGPKGLESIAKALVDKECALQRLDISINNLTDKHVQSLAGEFFSYPDLIPDQLDLKMNDIGLEGFEKLGNLIVRRKAPLTMLDLSGNEVGMRGILALLNAFLACPDGTPKDLRLGLHGLESILKEEIPSLIQIPVCSMEKLFVTNDLNRGGGPLDDESAFRIARSLMSNSSLAELRTLTGNLSEHGWKHFITLLCDTSTIRSTYESNHVLNNHPAT